MSSYSFRIDWLDLNIEISRYFSARPKQPRKQLLKGAGTQLFRIHLSFSCVYSSLLDLNVPASFFRHSCPTCPDHNLVEDRHFLDCFTLVYFLPFFSTNKSFSILMHNNITQSDDRKYMKAMIHFGQHRPCHLIFELYLYITITITASTALTNLMVIFPFSVFCVFLIS